MALLDVVFGLWQILALNVQSVGYEPDEEMRERMEQRAEMLKWEMTRLWQEVEERSREQRNQEQSNFAWVSLLLSALQHWQFWVIAGVLVLLFGLCWWLRKWSCEPQREEESSGNNVVKKKHGEENNDANEDEEGSDNANRPEEENDGANEDEEGDDNANEAQEQNDDPNEDEEGNDDANEAQEQNDDANEPEEENDNGNEGEEENDGANEDEEENDDEDQEENDDEDDDEEENDDEDQEENDDANDPGRFFEEDTQWPDQNRDRECKSVLSLMEIFTAVYQQFFSNTCFPVLEKAIEVGSAFEGWSPREEDITYRLLLPLKPPRGHLFHLEPGPLWPMRNFRIRVELVCTCEMAQPAGRTRCFLHDAEQEQRRNEGPNILEDLCTDSYLDVQKTARYFQMFVRRSWRVLPISAAHRLTVLPSDRSCKFCVTQRRGKRILIELMFGVQEGTSDIFVSSQYTEAAYTPSTIWPESYAVAEMKFFRHIASQAQPDTCHLRCLQICARCLLGRDFSTYTLKTVMMHVLTTIPLSNWRRKRFWEWLNDIMQYLRSCLKERRLNHFFIGNANVPEEINVPLELQMAEPVNLFQHLTQNPYASQHAQLEFEELGNRIRRMVLHRR
ncbi:inositol 1,4,5-trisphosphate receptor-interacting protein-like 1 [Patagioenas fasciata monilis]|uniref:Inositol 1,4,5-trisphosphate receptor-interacting protein-like 1 n=1 Tax=Patagioenas fasciata monilis TaxID=372326 RepID=A0A1V4KAA8_PATFA|nr:inositol 1,4,5-trisphosphate receptor-interacting protein-like 1 [Patagioenas fasciata monilis]